MKNIITILMLIFSITAFSQNSLKGYISDYSTLDKLPNAYIYVGELHKTCISDTNGYFELQHLPNGIFTVQFSYVGYETDIRKINFSSNTSEIQISLHPSFVESQEIVISAGSSSAQHENAIKIESIKAEVLEKQDGMSLMANLSHQPGVSVISKGPGVVSPVIRGLSTTNILVLNNDIRMENFQFSENHPFLIDEAGIDQIEIIKGPASLLYGSDAIGGIINVIKEKPAPVGTIIGDINLKYFGNTKGIQSNIGVKGSSNDFFWGLRAEQKTHADYKQGCDRFVPNSRFNAQSAHGFVGLHKSFASFKLYYDYNQTQLGLVVPGAIPLVIAGERKNSDWYQDLTDHMLISKNKFFLNRWQLDANLSYQLNHRKLITDHNDAVYINTDMLLQTYTYELKAKWNPTDGQSLIIGYSGMHQFNVNKEAPDHVLPNYYLNDNSLFALLQYNFGRRFHSQLGLRYDMRTIDVPLQEKSGLYKNIGTKTMIDALSKQYSNLSGSLGFTYDLSKQWLLRINLASAYRSPNIAELTQDGMHGNRYEQGNSDLVAQRNYELDMSTHYHIKKFKFDLALFHNYINNYIFLSPTSDSTIAGAPIYKYQQSASTLYGLETGFEYFILKNLNLHATFAHITGIQENKDYLPFIPQDKFHLNLILKKSKLWFMQHAYLNLGADYVLKQNKPSPFETYSPAYQILNMNLGSQIFVFNQLMIWQLSISNLLDTMYIDHLSTLKPMAYYNIGRSVNLSIKIPFG